MHSSRGSGFPEDLFLFRVFRVFRVPISSLDSLPRSCRLAHGESVRLMGPCLRVGGLVGMRCSAPTRECGSENDYCLSITTVRAGPRYPWVYRRGGWLGSSPKGDAPRDTPRTHPISLDSRRIADSKSPSLRPSELDRDIHGFTVADDGDADGLAGPVFLDLGEQLVEGLHPLVIDGDDQVGAIGVDGPADEAGPDAARPAPGRPGARPARPVRLPPARR